MTPVGPATVFDAFKDAARDAPDNPFLVVPESAPDHVDLTYGGMLERVRGLTEIYRKAGYGHGHRVALLLENRPAFTRHWLALNGIGAAVVPVNPDFKGQELRFLLRHSAPDLAVVLPGYAGAVRDAAAAIDRALPIAGPDAAALPAPAHPGPRRSDPDGETLAALLYTSGTTGAPKGCRLTNAYFAAMGRWYCAQGGLCTIRPGEERLMTPLPLFHMNALACSFMAMVQSRGCLVQLDRFHPRSWWEDAVRSDATIFHYLGIMPAILLSLAPDLFEGRHRLRFGFGANVDPAHHAAFEERFRVPLIEAWAMSETGAGACIAANREPREVGTRCFGRPESCEVRIVDEEGEAVAPGDAGELLVRHAADAPRQGFFAGYHHDDAATEAAWAGGWFHTGDVVRAGVEGRLHFVERKKNLIRRAGENIAALEVETTIASLESVAHVAVVPIADDLRGEEVLACVTPAAGTRGDAVHAEAIVAHCLGELAYFKAPGHVLFLDALPATPTQKVMKHVLREIAEKRRGGAGWHDLRALKRPSRPEAT